MTIPLSPSLETTGLNFFLWSPYSPVKYYSTFLTHHILGCLYFVFLSFFLDPPFSPQSEHPRSTSVRVCSPAQGLRSEVSPVTKGQSLCLRKRRCWESPSEPQLWLVNKGFEGAMSWVCLHLSKLAEQFALGGLPIQRQPRMDFLSVPLATAGCDLAQLPPKLESRRGEASMSEAREPHLSPPAALL